MNKQYVNGALNGKKGLLDKCSKYHHKAPPLPVGVKDNVSTVQRTETNRDREWVSGVLSYLHEATNKYQ